MLVAASILTLTLISFSPPTRVILLSCKALNTFACAERLISPISSIKSVPPSACSKHPLRCFIADVNAPFSCPKSSLSINSDGIAAQFTSTNGDLFLFDCSCMLLATNSFPVPFSPVINTLASLGATLAIISLTANIPADSPTI